MMKRMTRIIIIAFVIIGIPVLAKSEEYFLQIDLHSANAYISINGFPLTVEIAGTMKEQITLFLMNGANKIEVAYCPSAISRETSKLTWSILETPDGSGVTSKNAKCIAEGSVGSRVISWPDLSAQDFTVYRGSIDEQHNFVFQPGNNNVSIGGRLRQSLVFTRLPSRISYRNLAQPITNATIHFMKSGTPVSVKFSGLTFPQGDQTVDLPLDSISSGAQWAVDTGYDEILIEGQPADTNGEPLMLSDLKIAEIQGVIKDSRILNLKLPRWHWQEGDQCTALAEKDIAEIWQITKTFYDALQQKNISVMDSLLKDRMILYQEYLHLSPEQMNKVKQMQFATITSQDMMLEPISPSNVRYLFLNPQIVTVKTLDNDDVIRTITPADRSKGGVTQRFELFFSRIGGKWVISL